MIRYSWMENIRKKKSLISVNIGEMQKNTRRSMIILSGRIS